MGDQILHLCRCHQIEAQLTAWKQYECLPSKLFPAETATTHASISPAGGHDCAPTARQRRCGSWSWCHRLHTRCTQPGCGPASPAAGGQAWCSSAHLAGLLLRTAGCQRHYLHSHHQSPAVLKRRHDEYEFIINALLQFYLVAVECLFYSYYLQLPQQCTGSSS